MRTRQFPPGPASGMGEVCAALLALSLAACPNESRIESNFCHAIEDGTPCDDGNPCSSDDRCDAGVCLGQAIEDRTECDDGAACTVDDECMAGVCVGLNVCAADVVGDGGQADPCADLPEGTVCDDGDACTLDDVCTAGACAGALVDCSASAAACVAAACDPATGACVATPIAEGEACDDGNPCTTGEVCAFESCVAGSSAPNGTACSDGDPQTVADVCVNGICVGSATCQGECCALEEGASCDDGDLCTDEASCQSGVCVPVVKEWDCTQFDSQCTVGRCDKALGACAEFARPQGTECDDGKKCTAVDTCLDGTCLGLAVDCSHLDQACVAGVCQELLGECQAVPKQDDLPCSDGDPCTGHDDCESGVCKGDINLCVACDGKQPGDACDDGDRCTDGAGVCAQVSTGLRCDSNAVSCGDPNLTCGVQICDSDSDDPSEDLCASAIVINLHNGANCDDGNACTQGDTCAAGACEGTEREMCGADSPDFCEPRAANDSFGTAIPLALKDGVGTIRVLGGLSHAADVDWYAVDVSAGKLVDVITSAHCNSTLRSLISVVRPSGTSSAFADPAGGFATMEGDRPGGEGTYFIGISSLEQSDPATYFMRVTVRNAPPCTTDAECGCPRLTCDTAGGVCEPSIATEHEPNDASTSSVAMKLSEPVLGRVGSSGDYDWYRIDLSAKTALNVSVTASCDEASDPDADVEALDSEVRLYAANGTTELAFSNQDGLGGVEARLNDVVIPADGQYYLRVAGEGGALGAYELEASLGGCSTPTDCTCADQTCPTGSKICLPRLTSAEPTDASAPDEAVLLSQRFHAEIKPSFDADGFSITLADGTFDVVTETFCGSVLDTQLVVYDMSGSTPVALADDDDSGEQKFAAIRGLTIGAAKPLRVVVTARGAAVGDYIVVVRPTTEAP